MGCGELLINLRKKITELKPGQVIKLTALDGGALEDIPAWCKLTGHTLVQASHPLYFIQRRIHE
jgi:tRNA 2-thiouridine synthesizing protein A